MELGRFKDAAINWDGKKMIRKEDLCSLIEFDRHTSFEQQNIEHERKEEPYQMIGFEYLVLEDESWFHSVVCRE